MFRIHQEPDMDPAPDPTIGVENVKIGRDPRLTDLNFDMAVFRAFNFFLKERILKISEDIYTFYI
jgi:hypothetical protein